MLLLSRSEDPEFVAELRIFNPDGSEAELSGNGAREAILYLRRHGWTDADTFAIRTVAGPITPTITGELTCSVDMGRASTDLEGLPLGRRGRHGARSSAGGREWEFQHVSIGNPQCAIVVGDELEELDLGEIGPEIEGHELFPNRTNVSFLAIDGSRVRARIFERGVGETLSSGTGASGAAVDRLPARRREPDHGRARRRRARGRDPRGPRRAPDRLGRAGLRRRALAGAARSALRRRCDD